MDPTTPRHVWRRSSSLLAISKRDTTHTLPFSRRAARTLYRSAWIVFFFSFPLFFLLFTETPADHRAVQEVPPLGDSPTLSQFSFNTDLLALLRQYTSCHSATTFWGYRFLAWMVRVTVLQFPFTISPILKEVYSAQGQVFRGIIGFVPFFLFFLFLQVEIIIMFSREWSFFLTNKRYEWIKKTRRLWIHWDIYPREFNSSKVRLRLTKRLPTRYTEAFPATTA